MSRDNCADFACEFNGEGDHSHVGVRPYLRRVLDVTGKLIDGATGKEPVIESDDSKSD